MDSRRTNFKVFVVLMLFGLHSVSVAREDQSKIGILYGKVVNQIDSVIAGVTVTIVSGDRKYTKISDGRGEFLFEVLPGIYQVTAELPNIFPYRRAEIQIGPSEDKFIVIRPAFVGPSQTDYPESPESKIKYEISRMKSGMQVMIRYESLSRTPSSLVFSGDSKMMNLMISSDSMALYAKAISCDINLTKCIAESNIVLEIGREKLERITAEIDLLQRKVHLTREPKVIKSF